MENKLGSDFLSNKENDLLLIEHCMDRKGNYMDVPNDLQRELVLRLSELIFKASRGGATNEEIFSSLKIMKERTGERNLFMSSELISRMKLIEQVEQQPIDPALVAGIQDIFFTNHMPDSFMKSWKRSAIGLDARLSEASRHPEIPGQTLSRMAYDYFIGPIAGMLGVKSSRKAEPKDEPTAGL